MGALVVAFDIVFAEPDRMSPNIAADAFRDLDEVTREKLRALPSNDTVLADALRQSRVVAWKSQAFLSRRRNPRECSRRSDSQPWAVTRGHIFEFPGIAAERTHSRRRSQRGAALFTHPRRTRRYRPACSHCDGRLRRSGRTVSDP